MIKTDLSESARRVALFSIFKATREILLTVPDLAGEKSRDNHVTEASDSERLLWFCAAVGKGAIVGDLRMR